MVSASHIHGSIWYFRVYVFVSVERCIVSLFGLIFLSCGINANE